MATETTIRIPVAVKGALLPVSARIAEGIVAIRARKIAPKSVMRLEMRER